MIQLLNLPVVRAWAVITLAALLCGDAQAQESSAKTGVRGLSRAVGTVNFSELAGSNAPAASGVRRANPSVERRRGAEVDAGVSTTTVVAQAAATGGLVFSAAADPPSPPPSTSFQGLLDNAVVFSPDTQGAVGTNYLMVVLGSEVRVQNRSGGAVSTVSLDAFWGALGSSNVFDPRVLYDPFANRFVTVAMANPESTNSVLLVGVSQTGDPTGNWFLRSFSGEGTNGGNYVVAPHLGLSRDWITISGNLFDQTGEYFSSVSIWAFDRTNLYAAGPASFSQFHAYTPDQENIPVPAISYDAAYPTNFLVANWNGNVGGFGLLRIFSISGPVNAPVYNDYSELGFNGLQVFAGAAFGNPNWESFPPPGTTNFAPQLGTSQKISIGDARMQSVVFRNGALWCAHHVFLTNGVSRCAVQWWGFTPGGLTVHHGRVDDPAGGKFYAYPSLAVNLFEDVLLGYTRFGANQYPSANYSFHAFEDGPGKLQLEAVLKAGEGKFTVADGDLVLWGDWSATTVDPLNDTDLWTLQEYAAAPVGGEDRWGTWWGRISPKTSLSLSVTDLPDPVIVSSNVTYSIRITNNTARIATGVKLSSTLPPGSTFVSSSSSQGSCGHTNGLVSCNFGDVAGALNTNIVVTATIVARLNQSGTATNLVSITSFGQDENPLDNGAVVRTTVNTSADLALAVAAVPSPVILSNNVTWSVVLTNRGPSPATSASLTNTLPAGVTFISATPSQGSCAQSAGRVTCTFGTLAANASVNIAIVTRATNSGFLTNVALAVSTALDPNLSNNTATVTARVNALPVLQGISDRNINEDAVLGPVAFTIGDLETPVDNLQLTGFSSNPSVVPAANIVFGGIGASRTLTVTPAPNASGTVTITRVLADADGGAVSNSFVLTVVAINDAPTISDIPDQVTAEDMVLGPIPFVIGDVENGAAALTPTGASSNTPLIPNAGIVFGGSGANRTVTIRPATNQFGSATITVTVSDGTTTTSDTFVVTVNPVNDLPTISDIADRAINEDSATAAIPFSVGDVETSAMALVPGGSSSNPALVPAANFVFGGTGASRNVVITPAPNQFGTATITISVTDTNGGVRSDTFQLTVNPVNDAPTLDSLPNRIFNEDAGTQVITLANISVGATNEAQTNVISVTSSNPGLIPTPLTNYTPPNVSGSISFAPVANSNGVSTITVTVNDGGASNNVISRSFNVTILAVNDVPTISAMGDATISEDSSTGALPFVVGDVESPATALTVRGASSNTNLVPDTNITFSGSGSNRTVTVVPQANQFGTATITVFVGDGAGTNSRAFQITVVSVNDLPTISAITSRSIDEDSSTNISFSIGDIETSADSLVLSATSSNPTLVPSFTFGGSGSNRTVTPVLAANEFGSATITVRVVDANAGTNTSPFILTVVSVNDLPTLNPINDLVLVEDSTNQTVLLNGISSGATNEFQPLTITAVSTNTALIPHPTVIYTGPDATGRIEFAPVPNASGTAAVIVSVSDGVSTNTRSFAVTVTGVNDEPVISSITNLVVMDEDATAIIPFTITDLETPAEQLSVQAVSSVIDVLDESGISFTGTGTNRSIHLTPVPNVSGSTTITISVTDGSNATATVSFELEVLPVNDAPIATGLTELTIDEDSTGNLVAFTVSDEETFPDALVVTVASSNPSLVPNANVLVGGAGAGRTLTLTPLPNQFGITTISVVVAESALPGALSSTNSFLLTVAGVNDAPTLDPIAPLIVTMNSGLQNVPLTGLTMGATNEGQVLSVLAQSDNEAVIPVPVINYTSPGSTGTLQFTPAIGALGTVQLTVTVTETGGVLTGATNRISRQFNVQVIGGGPALVIENLAGNSVISWTTNSSMNWLLQSATNLTASTSWATVTPPPAISGGRFVVTNQINAGPVFYRLKNQ